MTSPNNAPNNPEQEKQPIDWRSRIFWRRAVAIFTLGWVCSVIVITKGDQTHWLSNLIFLVPLALWGGVLLVFRRRDRL